MGSFPFFRFSSLVSMFYTFLRVIMTGCVILRYKVCKQICLQYSLPYNSNKVVFQLKLKVGEGDELEPIKFLSLFLSFHFVKEICNKKWFALRAYFLSFLPNFTCVLYRISIYSISVRNIFYSCNGRIQSGAFF